MLSTPVKDQGSSHWGSPAATLPSTHKKVAGSNEYKAKVMDLMNENLQLKTRQKILQTRIETLQSKLQALQSELTNFLKKTNSPSLSSAVAQFQRLQNSPSSPCPVQVQPTLKQILLKIKESTIVVHLNQQISQYYLLTIGRKFQELELKYKGEREEGGTRKIRQQWEQMRAQCEGLREDNARLEASNEKLREELRNSIEKFQGIESIIEDKLKYYIEKLREYEELLKNSRNQVHEFSFGKDDEDHEGKQLRQERVKEKKEKEKEKERGNEMEDMNMECYRASIEGLLQQNKRLKKSFQCLYRLKQGEQVPEQLQKQINIMKSIIELNENMEQVQN